MSVPRFIVAIFLSIALGGLLTVVAPNLQVLDCFDPETRKTLRFVGFPFTYRPGIEIHLAYLGIKNTLFWPPFLLNAVILGAALFLFVAWGLRVLSRSGWVTSLLAVGTCGALLASAYPIIAAYDNGELYPFFLPFLWLWRG
ncbi:MAG: hypothetical protein CR993_05935 [Rhodobacterales bacterium]|nr:MAG: hypothetical protein CR993_05935 [Rhodobacterales bacterium]